MGGAVQAAAVRAVAVAAPRAVAVAVRAVVVNSLVCMFPIRA